VAQLKREVQLTIRLVRPDALPVDRKRAGRRIVDAAKALAALAASHPVEAQ
jgi:hypothetical protein